MDGSLGTSYVSMEQNRIYTEMTAEELTKQYSPSVWVTRPVDVIRDHVTTITTASDKAKASLTYQEGVKYGDGEKQKMDIFAPDTLPKDAPIYIFIHGGYWQELSREMSSFAAENIVNAGALYVAMGYDLAPHASLQGIVEQVCNGVKRVIDLAKQRGSRGIYIGGHSAGGHLAAMMLSQDWDTIAGQNSQQLIRGGLLISGVYDLRPIVNTYVNDPIKMDIEEAWNNSPWNPDNLHRICELCKKRVKILVAIGENDSPEFRRQSGQYEQVLHENGIASDFLDVQDTDHFNVNDLQVNKDYVLTKKLIQLMELQG